MQLIPICIIFYDNISVVIAVWNILPDIIVNAESKNLIFNNRLHRLWVNHEFKFDWHAHIVGIGSQSLNS